MHTTVLLNEAVDALLNNPDATPDDAGAGTYVDATFGRGGHSRLILSRLAPQGRLVAFDKDLDALVAAAEIKCLQVDPLTPRMVVAVSENEEQALDLDLSAGLQEV